MGFFDNQQSFTSLSAIPADAELYRDIGLNEAGELGRLDWRDPNGTSSDIYAFRPGVQSNETLQSLLRAWGQANGRDLSHLGAFQGDPYDTERYSNLGQFDQARYQADMDALNAFARENFGDIVYGKTRVSGSDSDGGGWRTDLLQRTADGYRPISGATALSSDTGNKSDGRLVGAIIASWAGGHLLSPAAGGSAAGAEGGATAGAASSSTTGVTGANGAFLGEGAASGIPAWDASYAGAGGTFGGTGVASNEGVLGWSAEQPAGAEGGFNPNGLPEGSPYASDFAGAGGGQAAPGAAAASSGGGGSSWVPAATQALNAFLQYRQSGQARDALIDAGNQANATQRYIFDTLRADQAPYRQAGYGALDRINALMRDPNSITSDPGYEFQRKEGMRGIESSAAARGLGLSGAALKAANRFNTDYATTKLNDSYNRYASVAGIGQVANSQGVATGQNYANQVGATQQRMGNVNGVYEMQQGNIYNNYLNQLGAGYQRRGG